MAYDLKLYFESTAIANAITYGDSWDWDAGGSYYGLTTVKGVTDQTAFSFELTNSSSPWKAALYQGISAARPGRTWTAGDTFDLAFTCYESDYALNASLYVVIRVVSSDLGTVRGVLYDGNPTSAEWEGDDYFSRRHADVIAIQNTVVEQAGDKIVIEIGAVCLCAVSGYTARIYAGTDQSGDLALSDADSVQPVADAWIGFTYGNAGITLPITGVSGTASVGTVALSLAMAVSGVLATGAVGTLALDVSMAMSGIEAPASAGTLPPAMAAVLAGIEAVDAAGGAGVDITIPVTGNEVVGAVGDVARGATDMPVTGNEATASVDDLSPGSTLPITGNEATGAVGTVVAHIGVGPDITIPITGVSANPAYQLSGVAAAGAVGTVSPNIEYVDIILPITGVDATVAVGDVVYLTLGGWAATGEVGNVAPNVSPPITGNEAAAAVGDVTQDRSVGLNGAGASGEVGGWNMVTRPLTGTPATGEVGTLVPGITKAVSGNLGTTGIGSVVQTHDVGLTGAAGTGTAGHVDHFVAGDLVLPLTGIGVTTSIGALTCGTASPTYINVTPRKRILDVRPRRRILDVFRRRT